MNKLSDRVRARSLFAGLVIAFMILLAAIDCGGGSPTQQPYSGELHIYNWEDYFAPDTLANFQEEFGIQVHLTTFESEHEMVAALQSDPAAYDVVVASGSDIQTLLALKLLASIDHDQIPNLANIQPEFRGVYFDSEDQYSVPYMWGTTGLAVNSRLVDAEWRLLVFALGPQEP